MFRMLWWSHSAWRFFVNGLRVIIPAAFITAILVGVLGMKKHLDFWWPILVLAAVYGSVLFVAIYVCDTCSG